MKIKLELDSIQNALDVVSKIAAPVSGNITIIGMGGKVKILSASDLNRAQIIVPSELEGEGELSVSLQSLKDAVKGRSKIELAFMNSVLHVKSGAYKAELATVDTIPNDIMTQTTISEWVVTREQASWLKSALKQVSLKPTALLTPWMPAGIKVGPKSSFVACYDSNHMSWTQTREVVGDMELVMPIDVISSIVEVFHKTSFKIKLGQNSVQVESKLIDVRLSIPINEGPTLEQVRSKVKELASTQAATFAFSKSHILDFMSNARSVLGKDRAEIHISAGTKGVELMVKTAQGQVKNVVPGKGEGAFRIDYEYLMEAVSKSDSEIEMKVVSNSFASIKMGTSHSMIALNQ